MKNPSSGSRVVSCGRTERQIDMKKLLVNIGNFANCVKYNGPHFLVNRLILAWG